MHKDFNILKICRACENSAALVLMDTVPDLHQFFKTYLNINPLPEQEMICRKCLKIIEDFKEFDQRCQEVDEKLRRLLMPFEFPILKIEGEREILASILISTVGLMEAENTSSDDENNRRDNDENIAVPIDLVPAEAPKKPATSSKNFQNVILETLPVEQEIINEFLKSKEPQNHVGTPIEGNHTTRHIPSGTPLKLTKPNSKENVSIKKQNEKISGFKGRSVLQMKTGRKPNTISFNRYRKENEKFSCDICKGKFKEFVALKRHILRIHYTEFRCSYCDQLRGTNFQLWVHKFKTHEVDPDVIYCFYCKLPQKSRDLKDHLFKKHEISYEGFECELKFEENKQKETSASPKLIEILPETEEYKRSKTKCIRCQRIFKVNGLLYQHLYETHSVKQSKIFKDPEQVEQVKKLMKDTKGPRGHTCKVCGRFFINNSTKSSYSREKLRRHILRQHLEKTVSCTECDKMFAYRGRMLEHLYTHKSKAQRKYSCDICKKRYATYNKIRIHMESHLTVPWIFCEKCGRGFMIKTSFRKHMGLCHIDPSKRKVKIRKCTYCKKTFTSSDGFKRHIARHEGTFLKLRCKVCRKVFFSESSKEKHMTTHTAAEKSSIKNPKKKITSSDLKFCDFCGNSFKSMRGIRRHLMTFHVN